MENDILGDETDISFEHLPLDVIFNVFQYLTLRDLFRAALACRCWHSVLYDSRLWEHLTFTREDSASFIQNCLLKTQNLRSLSFFKCSNISDVYLKNGWEPLVSDSCRMLELLNTQISSCHIDSLVKVYPKLALVSLADSPTVFPDCLRSLLPISHTLVSLNLSYCCSLSDSDLSLMADSFDHVTEVDVEGNPYITDEGVIYMLQKIGKNLKKLSLDGENLSDLFAQSLSLAPKLQQFSMAYAENLSCQGFCCILRALRHLQALKMRKIMNLEDEEVSDTIAESPWMQSILVLELNDCQSLGDLSACALSKVCRNVRALSMEWWVKLTDTGVADIINQCHLIESLNITGAFMVTGKTSFDLNLALLIPRLHKLNLEKCHSFDDQLFIEMKKSLPHIKIFNYYGELIENYQLPCDINM